MIARFIDEQAARLGVALRIPAVTLAPDRVRLPATGSSSRATSTTDEDDLYEPFLELLISAWETSPDAGGAG